MRFPKFLFSKKSLCEDSRMVLSMSSRVFPLCYAGMMYWVSYLNLVQFSCQSVIFPCSNNNDILYNDIFISKVSVHTIKKLILQTYALFWLRKNVDNPWKFFIDFQNDNFLLLIFISLPILTAWNLFAFLYSAKEVKILFPGILDFFGVENHS